VAQRQARRDARRASRNTGSSGSSGGSSGSYGSSGSSGGTYASYGSGGSTGSSGGSGGYTSGSHGSGGSTGGYISSGSGSAGYGSGGSYAASNSVSQAQPVYAAARVVTPTVVNSPTQPVPPTPTQPIAVASRDSATLVVQVPEDAVVYLVGQKMSITGPERHFRIPISDAGREYTYPVRVEVVRNGETLASETQHKIRAGQQVNVVISESDSADELVAVAMR